MKTIFYKISQKEENKKYSTELRPYLFVNSLIPRY